MLLSRFLKNDPDTLWSGSTPEKELGWLMTGRAWVPLPVIFLQNCPFYRPPHLQPPIRLINLYATVAMDAPSYEQLLLFSDG